jgi:hypothetical protein
MRHFIVFLVSILLGTICFGVMYIVFDVDLRDSIITGGSVAVALFVLELVRSMVGKKKTVG